MTSFPTAQNSIASNTSKNPAAGIQSVRAQQSAWGLPAPGSSARRGLAPLSTNISTSSLDSTVPGRLHNTSSPSPFTPSFSSVLNSSHVSDISRSIHNTSSSTLFTSQSGSQQAQTGQSLLSPRSRAITPSSNTQSASSAAASTTASQVGGGGNSGGGGSARAQTFSPSLPQYSLNSPTNNSFDRSPYTGSNSSSAASGQSSVSKIVVTQVFLLLGSITEKEGKAKWESQAEAIRKLVESNGMEVYSKYFRRLLVGNSPHIFPGVNRNVENPSNYQLLVQEMEKVTQDPEQAPKIADIIDSSEGDIFRDFDLSTFISHFNLDPLAKTLLASAFTHVTKPDLKMKAGVILSNNRDELLQKLANVQTENDEVSPSLLATCALKFLEDLPLNSRTEFDSRGLVFALKRRYSLQHTAIPPDVSSTLVLLGLMDSKLPLMKDLRSKGPHVTSSLGATKDFLSQYNREEIDEHQVAAALLLMILTPIRQQYSPALFLSVVHDPLDTTYWESVVQELDLEGFEITKDQFLTLFNSFLPIAQANLGFDIQGLWGGQWRYPETQLSFLRCFLSCSPSELDATSIPNLRQAYDPRESLDGSDNVTQHVESALRDTMISVDAITAIYDLLVRPDKPPTESEEILLAETIGTKEAFFLCSSLGVQKPWTDGQQIVMLTLLKSFLRNNRSDSAYVLHTMWRQDKQWTAMRLIDIHSGDPLDLTIILDSAREHGWLEDLLTLVNGFALDLAALAHRQELHDLKEWAKPKLAQNPIAITSAISKFLLLKTQDELRTARDEQPLPRTVSLAMRTVYDMLDILDGHMVDRIELKALQRQCLQAYPRLIIYCEGIRQDVDVDYKASNRLPRSADEEMQDLYKRMYNEELEIERIIENLQEWRASADSSKVDIFACMIHGLFDEFSCFGEYPTTPLKMTAVLFGGIISFKLISNLTLQVAQEMILDAIRDYPQNSSMFKFGLQALLHIQERFQEPEWAGFCSELIHVPGLRGTDPYTKALQYADVHGTTQNGSDVDDEISNDLTNGLPNGEIDSFLSPDTVPQFKSVNAEPASTYDDPHEDIQEKVVFFFNNVSPENYKSKLVQLQEVLPHVHASWFASFLVDSRAKNEPNNQPTYLDILNLVGNKFMWNEVLRETYVSIKKLLNAESTMQSAAERKSLKHLSVWLGRLTIARNKPIKHKHISFLDLLIEGVETQRLNLVIPLTCNILTQGKYSVVYKPPNPWFADIVAALLELYFHFDIKLNLKFEIEVLFNEFGLPIKEGEESDCIRNRPHDETISNAILPDGPNGFIDMALGGIERPVRNSRFEIGSIFSALPDLESLLNFPPATGSAANQAKLREIVLEATKRAISEIIAPVVERSVTIATIATSALIHKDFARESDEDRVRRSAHQMVRQLSGSLALVTSKEPLKVSMTNHIRMAQAEVPDQAFPEGAILMCVNDNLDIACDIVEKHAEERSMPEIEAHIEAEIAARRQHRLNNPHEPFQDSAYSHWSNFIPDPYKQSLNGLNQEQVAIYLDFARQSRGPANHAQSSSGDSGRQVPDVLQDAFASVPSVHTPATDLAMPYAPPQQQQQSQPGGGRMLPPPPLHTPMPLSQVNGYSPIGAIHEQVLELLGEISRLIKEDPEKSMSEVQRDMPTVIENLNRTWELIASSPDSIALTCAEQICKMVYVEPTIRLEIEVFVHLLARLFQMYPAVRREVGIWATTQIEMKVHVVDVTVPLVKVDIMAIKQVDASLAGLLYDRVEGAVEALSEILHALLLNDRPTALRSDFSYSLGAFGQLVTENSDYAIAQSLLDELKDWGVSIADDSSPDERSRVKKHQLQYVFTEWIALCNSYPKNPDDQAFSVFIFQLQKQRQINTSEDMAVFLRLSLDEAIRSYEETGVDADGPSTEGLYKVDWLARLIVLMVKNQGERNGSVRQNKAVYMDSILSLLTLILNHLHNLDGEHFNQRVFFRLFSTILSDWHEFARENHAQDRDMLLIFAENFLSLSPRLFPGFTHSWLMLVSHRLFMPSLLKLGNDEGWEPYSKLMEEAFSYICQLLKPKMMSELSIDLYRALLRVVLVLHHDFPEFLAENHFRLCNAIPRECTQFQNLILSAFPSSMPELPNPFVVGLKIDRIEDVKNTPTIAGDYTKQLVRAYIKDLVESCLKRNDISDDEVAQVVNAAYNTTGHGITVNPSLLHALVLYIGQSAIHFTSQKGGQAFKSDSPQALLLTNLARELHPEARFYFISAMVNQLRYPNSHTLYFCYVLLHLIGNGSPDQQESGVREQIIRVLLERAHAVKPHPWGLISLIVELIQNPDYNFFQLPFITNTPGVSDMIIEIIERLQ